MEIKNAIAALAALAQDTRLAVFRHLVQQGPDGASPGAIALALGLPAPTLSFHLKELKQANLIACRRVGRSLVYAADYPAMNNLVEFLTENCCQGNPAACRPSARPSRSDGSRAA